MILEVEGIDAYYGENAGALRRLPGGRARGGEPPGPKRRSHHAPLDPGPHAARKDASASAGRRSPPADHESPGRHRLGPGRSGASSDADRRANLSIARKRTAPPLGVRWRSSASPAALDTCLIRECENLSAARCRCWPSRGPRVARLTPSTSPPRVWPSWRRTCWPPSVASGEACRPARRAEPLNALAVSDPRVRHGSRTHRLRGVRARRCWMIAALRTRSWGSDECRTAPILVVDKLEKAYTRGRCSGKPRSRWRPTSWWQPAHHRRRWNRTVGEDHSLRADHRQQPADAGTVTLPRPRRASCQGQRARPGGDPLPPILCKCATSAG